jgi:hypothetical protein
MFSEFSDATGLVFDAAIALGDLERLEAVTSKIVTHADSFIAHNDKTKPDQSITFDEMDAAAVLLEELTKRYSLLLTGRAWRGLTPYDQGDTLAAFKIPWIDAAYPPSFAADALLSSL